GDGHRCGAEACDDGNSDDCDACHRDCTSNSGCADRHVCAPETCDDGNATSGDGCSASCRTEEVQGDDYCGAAGTGTGCGGSRVAFTVSGTLVSFRCM